jgi:FkbH-like protein
MNISYDSQIRKNLFSREISRKDVLNCNIPQVEGMVPVRINIWRNSGIEFYLPVIEKYLNYFGYQPSFKISAYDSSLDIRSRDFADLDLIYISTDDLTPEKTAQLLELRVGDLLANASKHVSLAIQVPPGSPSLNTRIDSLLETFPDLRVVEVSEDELPTRIKFQEMRLLEISANWLAVDAYAFFGRKMAMNLILPVFMTKIKLIAVDLDNTLYNGVLAEDGLSGIFQSEFQHELILWLETQKEKGILLAVVSRNVIEDVTQLFEHLPKLKNLFDFVHASWSPKETHIRDVLRETRISEDTILFIDDSISELENVTRSLPKIQGLQYSDEKSTIDLIQSYPAILSKKSSNLQEIDRASDLKSNKVRDSIFSRMTDEEAFKTLEVRITYDKDDTNLVPRSAELSNKTNQFNFSLKRFNEFDLNTYLKVEKQSVILATLEDKFAKSGIVSLMCVNYSNNDLIVIDEFCISCRALGRGLEDEIFFGSLSKVLDERNVISSTRIRISYQLGERNSPVIEWASSRDWEISSSWVDVPINSFLEWRTLISTD